MIDPHNISSQKIAAINDLYRTSLGVPTFCGNIPGRIAPDGWRRRMLSR